MIAQTVAEHVNFHSFVSTAPRWGEDPLWVDEVAESAWALPSAPLRAALPPSGSSRVPRLEQSRLPLTQRKI
jgi:hypothetical protein